MGGSMHSEGGSGSAVRWRAAGLVLALCFVGALCEGFDIQAAGVAATGLKSEFRPTPRALGLFFSASGMGLFIGALVGGHLADRLGRKAVLVGSVVTFGCFSIITSYAPTVASLTGMRFLTGLGLGGAMPNLIAVAADISTLDKRSRSIAAAYVGMPLGGSLAGLVAYLTPAQQWRELFLIGGIAPLALAPALMATMADASQGKAALPGPKPEPERFVQELLGPGRALRSLTLWGAFFLIVLTLHLMLNWLPLLLIARGLARGTAAIAQAAFNGGGAVVAFGAGSLLDGRWRRFAIGVSLVCLPIILVLVAISPPQPLLLIALAALLGSAILAQQIIAFAIASACYPTAVRGTGVGAAVAAGRLGSLIGPLVAAELLASGRTSSQVLLGLLPIVLACGVCIGTLSQHVRLTAPASIPD